MANELNAVSKALVDNEMNNLVSSQKITHGIVYKIVNAAAMKTIQEQDASILRDVVRYISDKDTPTVYEAFRQYRAGIKHIYKTVVCPKGKVVPRSDQDAVTRYLQGLDFGALPKAEAKKSNPLHGLIDAFKKAGVFGATGSTFSTTKALTASLTYLKDKCGKTLESLEETHDEYAETLRVSAMLAMLLKNLEEATIVASKTSEAKSE